MTRAEVIRNMSDEELAVFMARLTLGRAPTDREYLFALSHLQSEDEYAEGEDGKADILRS